MKHKLKHRLLVFLILGISALFCRNINMNAKTVIKSNVEYNLNEKSKTASLSKGTGAEKNFEIPTTIVDDEDTYRVVSIEEKAFSGSDIEGVTIPESVNVIGKQAFEECRNLTALSLSGGNSKIEEFAFYGSGITNLKIPEGVSYIGNSAFSNCIKLKSVLIPSSVTYLGENAFSWCTGLETIEILDGLKEIPDMAFYHCTKLKSIKIPDTVEALGKSSFEWCSVLETIELSENLRNIGDQAFSRCGKFESVVIPRGVRYIGSRAFDGCGSLAYIEIPESVDYVGNLAFGNSGEDEQTKLRRVVCVRNSYIDNNEHFFQWNQYGISYPEFSYKVSDASVSGSIFGEYTFMAYVAVGILLIVIISGIVIVFKNKDKRN